MNYFLKKRKWMAWLVLLTFLFTSFMPTNLLAGNSVAWGWWPGGGSGDVKTTAAFGWNIAASIKRSGGTAVAFSDTAAYNAVASNVKVYLGKVDAKHEISRGTLDTGVTIGDVITQGLTIVIEHGLTFSRSSFCCNDKKGFGCNTAEGGKAGTLDNLINVNPAYKTENAGTTTIAIPAGELDENYFHKGADNSKTWLMLCVNGEGKYSIYYNTKYEGNSPYVLEHSQTNITVGTKIDQWTPPLKIGYTFDGWYTDSDLTTKWTAPEAMPAKDIMVYGKYVPSNVTINYVARTGGSVSRGSETLAPATGIVKCYNKVVTEVANKI